MQYTEQDDIYYSVAIRAAELEDDIDILRRRRDKLKRWDNSKNDEYIQLNRLIAKLNYERLRLME